MNTADSNHTQPSSALAGDVDARYADIDKTRFAELLDREFARPVHAHRENHLPSFYASKHRVCLSIRPMQMYVPESPTVLTLKADRYALSVT